MKKRHRCRYKKGRKTIIPVYFLFSFQRFGEGTLFKTVPELEISLRVFFTGQPPRYDFLTDFCVCLFMTYDRTLLLPLLLLLY